MRTTVGQALLNDLLPEDLRDYSRVLDKKGTAALFRRIAEKYPDRYADIARKFLKFGGDVSYWEGSSFGLSHLRTADAASRYVPAIRARVNAIAADARLDPDARRRLILEAVNPAVGKLDADVMAEALAKGNPLGLYAAAGARGNKSELNQMTGAPLLVTDHRQRQVPMPILRNYADGLDPAEMWATSFGVRKGYVDVKTATPKTGYFGKQLANAAHKLVVTDEEPPEGLGLEVDADDPDNEGAVLARAAGGHPVGTVLTPRILKELEAKGGKLLVYSPIAAPSLNGVPAKAAGIRETGELPRRGDNIGIPAAQALAAPLAQAMISSKHIGGVVGGGGKGTSLETQGAFGTVERLANIPKSYAGYAPVAAADGVVESIRPADRGGSLVRAAGRDYYVPPGQEAALREGERVEAGDVLGTGLPNPAEVVRHKGVGEGRRYLLEKLREVYTRGGVKHHRRNLELAVRGLVNHVRITDPDGRLGHLPDDIVEYDRLAATYAPREGARTYPLATAAGKYLEKPVLHYSIGTRITPRMVAGLKRAGVGEVLGHESEPEFEPAMQRAVDALAVDPDWMVQLNGFNLRRNFQKSLYAGRGSSEKGLSYIPRLARGVGFEQAAPPADDDDEPAGPVGFDSDAFDDDEEHF
jgi:DNA-directed RNA polymerase subunit beta'